VWRATTIATAAFLLLVGPLWLWSYQHYGTILTTQDSVELAARGSVVAALATSLVQMDWLAVVDWLFVPGRPWVGGWTFLPMNGTLAAIYGWYWGIALAAAAAGPVVAMVRRARSAEPAASPLRAGGDSRAGLAVCAAVVVFTVLGMSYHAVLSHAVFGRVMTTPWYFMTALPFLFVLLIRGLEPSTAGWRSPPPPRWPCCLSPSICMAPGSRCRPPTRAPRTRPSSGRASRRFIPRS
jgi:hypothetical protein